MGPQRLPDAALLRCSAEALGDRVVLMVAERNGEPVAGALNLLGREALYGRNWGCRGDSPFLHFELCYYRAIDFAIEHGLPRVEAGAQGEHKIQRGYLPRRPIRRIGSRIPGCAARSAISWSASAPAMLRQIAALAELSPFRKDGEAE